MAETIKSLSKSEEVVMKAILDLADKEGSLVLESVRVTELIEHLKIYGKNYKRTTVVTFLARLESKGAIQTYRIGRYSYVLPQYSLWAYRKKLVNQMINFWYAGNIEKLIEEVKGHEKA